MQAPLARILGPPRAPSPGRALGRRDTPRLMHLKALQGTATAD